MMLNEVNSISVVWFRRLTRLTVLLGIIVLGHPQGIQAGQIAKTTAVSSLSSHVVKFRPNMRASALASRPNSDFIQFSNGKRMRLGNIRRLTAAMRKMRITGRKPLPPAIRICH